MGPVIGGSQDTSGLKGKQPMGQQATVPLHTNHRTPYRHRVPLSRSHLTLSMREVGLKDKTALLGTPEGAYE